ncbi:mannitol dehydrogenase family protein [Streptomyces marispadix]|uniref:Mannitol-1-phosphate 5-dehydrogenase n=1 Tax=Streptomyces marispadix TaxID=2922868 RepID=A0ABS9T4Y2_9ACTN|nr:mannitol dehydrogenase family protein [Streptomyces marispadix]MCH6163326.1 mannitol dehydrogenase family protein [Streptomyces marispadix]
MTAFRLDNTASITTGEEGAPEAPRYDRTQLTAGIVHFGVGNFHRAHQAMAIDRLLADGLARDYGICGVGVLPSDARMRDVLTAQNGLYTLELRHPDGSREARIIGSLIDYLYAPDDPGAVVERLARPEVRIVSLTVTEGGYHIDQTTGEFDPSDENIQHDLAHPGAPRSTFGLIVAGLRRRRAAGLPPFTVMSCDNLPGNGHVARGTIIAFARLQDADLADWISAEVSFPNSMVDRITPATSDADREHIRSAYHVDDEWPVPAEPFFQWVLEDDFGNGRPPFEQAGVEVVDDVTPYELMKLRLLNVGHQAMAYFGYLAGHRYVHEAMADPDLRALVRRYMDQEGTPTLPVTGVDLGAYKDTLFERFSNVEVADTLARLCAEGSDRIPKWLVPVIRENLAAGRSIRISAAICASWARYAEGISEDGEPFGIVDRLAAERQEAARRQRAHPVAFIENQSLFGDLAADRTFRAAYTDALAMLHGEGARATYRKIVQRATGS